MTPPTFLPSTPQLFFSTCIMLSRTDLHLQDHLHHPFMAPYVSPQAHCTLQDHLRSPFMDLCPSPQYTMHCSLGSPCSPSPPSSPGPPRPLDPGTFSWLPVATWLSSCLCRPKLVSRLLMPTARVSLMLPSWLTT